MSALDIVMLVGFTTGAVLHFYITWLIGRRDDYWGPEPSFIKLGVTLGVWHLGSLLAALFRILNVPDGHVLLRVSDTVVFASLSFLPATLAHAHVAFLGWRDDYRKVTRTIVRVVSAVGYVPLVLLPVGLANLWRTPYGNPVDAMGDWLYLFSIWHLAVLFQCAVVDKFLKRYFTDPRERSFFDRLALSLVLIGVSYLLVFPGGMRHVPGIGRWLEVFVQLASIVPTTIVAYYIFRYNLYKLVIQRSLVYALLGGVALVVYLYVIRAFDQFLVERYSVREGVIEAIGVVFMVLLAWPVRRAMDARVRQLFEFEIGNYRELVEQVATESHSFNELRDLLPYVESIVARALDVDAVHIALKEALDDGDRSLVALWQEMERDRLDMLEDDPKLWALGARAAWSLRRDDEMIGVMVIKAASGSLSSRKQAVLSVLARQIAVAIENCRLVEDKVRLERELMLRERLAVLGQLAATVAHEVKNPLSAIKSIAQVMQEEEQAGPRREDLRLIVGEVDRLNRTVTQLLNYTRPSAAEGRSITVAAMAQTVARLIDAEARAGGVTIDLSVDGDRELPGLAAAALSEALLNLALNAVQATPSGGRVRIGLEVDGDDLALEVTDNGPGIPESLLRKVREPFFTTKQRGTGLGLAIVERRLAELGGHMTIESPVDTERGTRVSTRVRVGARDVPARV